jgi:HEAT repeat protein
MPSTANKGPDAHAGTRRRAVALAGHLGDLEGARAGLGDPDDGVRAVALGALRRVQCLDAHTLAAAFSDPAAVVRRRACEEVVAIGPSRPPAATTWVTDRLDDGDPTVVEASCFALGELFGNPNAESDETQEPASGELPPPDRGSAVGALASVATGHADALCREAAVAALGAIGDLGGLAAILTATRDKPAVRRRAVLALAPFEGPEVDLALRRALDDRDWQVRQAAEDLGAQA